MAYVKSTILVGLADDVSMIRQTVGAVISGILGLEEAGAWPEALETLTKGMSSQDINLAEVSILAWCARSLHSPRRVVSTPCQRCVKIRP